MTASRALKTLKAFEDLPLPVKIRLQHLGFGKKDAWMTPNIGAVVDRFVGGSIAPCAEPVTNANGFQLLCSYSWASPHLPSKLKEKLPRIAVPGAAPTLLPFKLPMPISESPHPPGFRDSNLANLPQAPYDAMFCAMSVMSPDIKLDDVDVIVNRGVLPQLLRIAKGGACDPMRHELHLVNNTLVIFRGWSHIWEVVKEQETNYGRVFENMFARYDSQTGELGTHHRAILYNLGPLRCLVLVEVDAAIMMPKRHRKPQGWVYKGPPKPPSAREQQHNMTTHRYPRSKGKPSKRLERQPIMASQSATHEQSRTERAMFKSLNDASDLFSSPNFGQRVNVVHKGMGTLSSRTAELVTKVIRRGSTSKKHPQMYFGRTPFLVRGGYHRPTKTFVRGSIARTVNRMRVFQNLNQEALRRLVSILQRLREVTKGTQHKQALLVWTKSSAKAQVFEPRTYQRLPISEYWQKKFWTESTETPVCDSKDASESIT